MPARFYSSESPLDAAVSGYMAGDKYKSDKLHQQALDDLAYAQDRRQAEEFGIDKVKGYKSPNFSDSGPRGLFQGYSENTDAMDRNRPIEKAIAPEFFSKTLNPGKDASPDPGPPIMNDAIQAKAKAEADAEARRNNETTVDGEPMPGSREPNSAPMPPKSILEAPAKESKQVIGAPKQVSPGLSVLPTKQTIDFNQDASVKGDVALPKTLPSEAPVVQDFNPTAEMMAAIQDRVTAKPQKDSEQSIPVNTLPRNLRDKLGISPEFKGSIPSSILKEMIQGAYKTVPAAAADKSLNPLTTDAISSIEKGVPLSSAARMLAKNQGAPVRPDQLAALQSAESRAKAGQRFDETQGFKQKQSNRLSPNETIKVQDGYDAFKAANDLKATLENNLALFGPVKGRAGSYNPYDDSAQAMDSAIYAAKQSIGKFLEGGVLRAEDEKKYERMLPALSDTPEQAQAKLQLMYKKLGEKASGYRKALGDSGYDVSAFKQLEHTLNPEILTRQGNNGTGISQSAGAIDRAVKGAVGEKPWPSSAKNSEYQSELMRARRLLGGYADKISADPNAQKLLQEKRSQVDALLKEKYGRGFSEQ